MPYGNQIATPFPSLVFHCHYHHQDGRQQSSDVKFKFECFQEKEATSLVGQNSALVLRETDSGTLGCHDVAGANNPKTLRLKEQI